MLFVWLHQRRYDQGHIRVAVHCYDRGQHLLGANCRKARTRLAALPCPVIVGVRSRIIYFGYFVSLDSLEPSCPLLKITARTGFILACKPSSHARPVPIRLDYPNTREWRWQHQLLTSICLLCLVTAHVFALGGSSHLPLPCSAHISAAATASIMLVSCSSAVINCLVMHGLSQHIMLRSASPTGQVADMFVLLGSALRSRNAR